MKKLAIAAIVVLVTAAGGLAASDRFAAGDQRPVQANAPAARIVDGPALEMSTDTSAIVRWTTNSVDGTSVRYGVVHYGVDYRHLDQTAKNQNRFNKGLPTMIYRVQLYDLEPGLTYYYSVEFTDANGASQGTDGGVHQFTTQRQP
jgi:Purple acid Phosphatase, N-terminal domain